jgi:hypothetical protein
MYDMGTKIGQLSDYSETYNGKIKTILFNEGVIKGEVQKEES